MKCCGIRGATTVENNTKEDILAATKELLKSMVEANDVAIDDIACVFFTTTSDLDVEFPAVAARQMGWEDIALLCGHEMKVPHGLPQCLRVLMLVNTEKTPHELVHIYLKGAKELRHDTGNPK